jgi:hypothetical protein
MPLAVRVAAAAFPFSDSQPKAINFFISGFPRFSIVLHYAVLQLYLGFLVSSFMQLTQATDFTMM